MSKKSSANLEKSTTFPEKVALKSSANLGKSSAIKKMSKKKKQIRKKNI